MSHAFSGRDMCTAVQHINKERECFLRRLKARSAALLGVSMQVGVHSWEVPSRHLLGGRIYFVFSPSLASKRVCLLIGRDSFSLAFSLSFLPIHSACLSLRFELKKDADGQLAVSGSEFVCTAFLHVPVHSFIGLFFHSFIIYSMPTFCWALCPLLKIER